MKLRLAIVSALICAAPVRAEIVFQGYMTTKERTWFVLSVDKKKTSGWLTVGQTFGGVSLVAFDAKSEVLTVEKDGKRQSLYVVHGRAQATSAEPSQDATGLIVISIGQSGDRISVGDDVAMLDALKSKFEIAAAMDPQPTIIIQPPPDTKVDRLRLIIDLGQKAGLKRIGVRAL